MATLPRIPGYELHRHLGGGLMTAVYAGRDTSTDLPCAIKMVRPEWDDPSTAIKLLQREARACFAVQHPHLVRMLDAQVTKPPCHVVLELLAGETLRGRLQREYQLELPAVLWITRQTAEALQALHQAGFVHGDVKPENVRLVSDGQAKLIDLGFAHRPGENAALLRQGYVLGTLNYLAPELCGGEPTDTPASDLFSLGVMLFEMLTGQLPYPVGSVDETFIRHHADPPADIRRFIRRLPVAMTRLLDRLLARKPEGRPRAAAVVQQLVALEIATIRQRWAA